MMHTTFYLAIHFNNFFLKILLFSQVHQVDKINMSQFFKKKKKKKKKKILFKAKLVICVQFGPKLQHFIPHDLPYAKDFLRLCSIMGENRQTIVTLVNFLKKSYFQATGQFGSNLPQNYSTLYLVICHRVYFEIFLHDGTQQIDKICIGQFSPEILF